jgi:threonine dehydrogenase-like Zn-dependent dehydrogenase
LLQRLSALANITLRIRGISVGSRVDFENLNAFLEKKRIDLKPLIDRTFAFDDSEEAFHYLYSGAHVGKVVIKI